MRLVILLALLVSCRTVRCPVETTRCRGNIVEICDTLGRWITVEDCDKVSKQSSGEFTCRVPPDAKDAVCLPK